MAEELAHLVREEARRAGIVVETRMSHGCPCALIDPHQIKQAALNLVRNATQAMPGGGRLTIATEVPDDGSLAMLVDDTGRGIPEALRCQIFEPFFTSKPHGTASVCRSRRTSSASTTGRSISARHPPAAPGSPSSCRRRGPSRGRAPARPS